MPDSSPDAFLAASARELILEELILLGVDHLPPLGSQQADGAQPPPSHLAELATRIAACQNCELWTTRNKTVPGVGPERARVVLIGEAPGVQEDQTGLPFVGPAGQLLTKIIEAGMGLQREQVFIANILKCRPPGNRDPSPAEKLSCTPFLLELLRILEPEIIICLGRHAANHLLGTDLPLSRLRGKLHSHSSGVPILATYHPAYLLRTPSAKVDCWQDIQLAMKHLGISRPEMNR